MNHAQLNSHFILFRSEGNPVKPPKLGYSLFLQETLKSFVGSGMSRQIRMQVSAKRKKGKSCV